MMITFDSISIHWPIVAAYFGLFMAVAAAAGRNHR